MRIVTIAALVVSWICLPSPVPAQDTVNDPDPMEEARTLFLEGEYRAVVNLLAETPRSPATAYLLGRAYQSMQQHEEAAAALIEADTTRTRVLERLGQSLQQLGRPAEALQHYEAAYRQDSTRHAAALPLARLYAAKHAWDEAISVYRRLIEEDKNNPYLHARLGQVHRQADEPEMAISHLERAHQIDPKNQQVAVRLSRVYADYDHFISAGRVIDRALEHHPESPQLWRRRGELDLHTVAPDRAVAAFEKVERLATLTVTDKRNLGVAYFLQGRYSEAREVLAASFESDDTHGMTAFYLGLAHKNLGAPDEALRYLNRATVLFQQSLLADIHSRLGEVHRMQDDGSEAIRAYRIASQLDAQRPDLIFQLATLYDAYYADRSTALSHYERYLEASDDQLESHRRAYAEQRIRALREELFFEAGRAASDTSLYVPADTLEE